MYPNIIIQQMCDSCDKIIATFGSSQPGQCECKNCDEKNEACAEYQIKKGYFCKFVSLVCPSYVPFESEE